MSRFAVVCLAAAVALNGVSLAQESKSSASRGAKAKQQLAITPEREAAVRTFVERNHAELADLLAHLKENQSREYERAIRELFRVTERLATIQERDTTQYDLELALWTAQSQVQLLAAKMKMGDSDQLREELRAALETQADARLALLKHERQRAQNRLSRIEGDIAQFSSQREQLIERQLKFLTKSGRERPVSKPAGGKRATGQARKKAEQAP
jgi:hypothetical protein